MINKPTKCDKCGGQIRRDETFYELILMGDLCARCYRKHLNEIKGSYLISFKYGVSKHTYQDFFYLTGNDLSGLYDLQKVLSEYVQKLTPEENPNHHLSFDPKNITITMFSKIN